MEDKIEHKIPPFLPISIAFIGNRRLKRPILCSTCTRLLA